MADKDALKVGSKVWVKDKDLYGTVRSVKSAKVRTPDVIVMYEGLWGQLTLPLGSG